MKWTGLTIIVEGFIAIICLSYTSKTGQTILLSCFAVFALVVAYFEKAQDVKESDIIEGKLNKGEEQLNESIRAQKILKIIQDIKIRFNSSYQMPNSWTIEQALEEAGITETEIEFAIKNNWLYKTPYGGIMIV